MEAIQCGLCLEQYTENGRRVPLNIPCGHSACLDCLENIRNSCCPFCRKRFNVPIKNLSRNLTVIGLIDALTKRPVRSAGGGSRSIMEASKMSTEELRAHNRHIEEELAKRERDIRQLADLKGRHSLLRNEIAQMRATIQAKVSEMRQVEKDVHELEGRFNKPKTQFVDDSVVLIANVNDATAAILRSSDLSKEANVTIRKTFEAVSRFVTGSPERLAAIGSPGVNVIPHVVGLLRAHMSAPRLCESGLVAIKMLCRYGITSDTQNRANIAALVELGACKVIVIALRAHPNDIEVAKQACWCIRNLSGEAGDTLIACNACEALTSALKMHSQASTAVTEQACYAIANLCTIPDACHRFGQVGAPKAVALSLSIPIDQQTASACDAVSRAIVQLSSNHERNWEILQNSGAKQLLQHISSRQFLSNETRQFARDGAMMFN